MLATSGVSEEDFPNLKPLLKKVMSLFMSTHAHTSESTFFNHEQRNQLTDIYLECLTVITTTNYEYNMKKVKDMHGSFCMKVNMVLIENALDVLFLCL